MRITESLATLIYSTLDWLRRDFSDRCMAAGATMGFWLGANPYGTLHWWMGILATFFLHINPLTALVAYGVWSLVLWPMAGIFHTLGLFTLTGTPNLERFWAGLYHAPLIPFTRFNNTVVMGALMISTALVPAIYLGSLKLIRSYRKEIVTWFRGTSTGSRMLSSRSYFNYARHQKK